MTTLISEMKIPKPQRDGTAPTASTRLMLPRTEPGDSLTKKLLGAQQAKTENGGRWHHRSPAARTGRPAAEAEHHLAAGRSRQMAAHRGQHFRPGL